MTKEQIIKEYMSQMGRKGGSVTGPTKARKLSREHYQTVAQAQRERWANWREKNAQRERWASWRAKNGRPNIKRER